MTDLAAATAIQSARSLVARYCAPLTGPERAAAVAAAHTRSVDADGYLEMAGLSGLNPNGRHHVVILER